MASPDKKSKLPFFATVVILAMSFFAIYYVSTDRYRQQSRYRSERVEAINRPGQSRIGTYQLVLRKGERLDVGRTSLVYKGLYGKEIHVDLYLLDLDPKQPYLKKIIRKEAKEGFDLGGVKYRMISANDTYLTMKIISMSQTP